jgi:two-component system nitrogen regulation sensor histidine kinase NtrY
LAEPPAPTPPPRRRASDRGRAPFLDNTRRVLAGIAALIAALVGLLVLANRSTALAPDFLAEFVLYALVVTDLTIVVALVFVLTRNIVKLLVERRRALAFARFRAKLVAVLLAMTLVPALLVLIVGSELIRNSVARWFDVGQQHRGRVLPRPAGCRRSARGAYCAVDRVSRSGTDLARCHPKGFVG